MVTTDFVPCASKRLKTRINHGYLKNNGGGNASIEPNANGEHIIMVNGGSFYKTGSGLGATLALGQGEWITLVGGTGHWYVMQKGTVL